MIRSLPVTDHDRRRFRVTWRILAAGIGLGVVGAAAMGLSGFDGRVGFATVMLGGALGCVAAALTTAGYAIVDEARNAPVATRRLVVAVALFAGGAFLLMLVVAVAGSTP
jgi:drug/metabolite transporter (DMT)-like permease